jgi:hypothetical protein
MGACEQLSCGEIEIDSTSVAIWLNTRLPFEPKGEMREARDRLREALSALESASSETILTAVYTSLDEGFCDVENVLLYNVGSTAFAKSSQGGIRFERRIATPPQSPSGASFEHQNRYSLAKICAESPNTSVYTREFDLVSLSSSTKPHEVWWAFHEGEGGDSESQIQGAFALEIRLVTPKQLGNLASVIKPLLDGIISAMHSESNLDPVAAQRLAEKLGRPIESVVSRLQLPSAPILGPQDLLQVTSAGVKWNPADHLCQQCTVVVEAGAHWRCSASVMRLDDCGDRDSSEELSS